MVARLCRFKSCCPHQKKTIRTGCLFSCDSGLETKLRFVGKRHCVCVPLHAVQLAQRFASKLARLCYYARFALYKSCCPHQKKTIRKGCLFSCGSGLETKLRFVGKRHCVCLPLHAVQLAQRFASKLARLCYYARFALYKSCCPHQTRIKRTEITRFVFSYLWFATGLVTMQGIVCTLRVPLHAVQLTLHLRE